MQSVLTKPASPSTSMSLSVGLERDKSRQRDLPEDQLESWASLEDQVGDSHLAGGSRRGAGTGEVREELTNRAGSTTESCFARRGQIRPWHRSPPLLPPRCVCVRIQPWPCCRHRLLRAGMPGWRPRHRDGARCREYFVSCAGCGLSHGLDVHLCDPGQPGYEQPATAL